MDFRSMPNAVFALGRMTPTVVNLLGTVFSLNKPGFFATSSHVCTSDEQGLVIVFKQQVSELNSYQDTSDTSVSTFPVKIHAYDPLHDLAILRADVAIQSNINIGGTDNVSVGESLLCFGYPHADHGRMVLTQQNTEVGAKVLIDAGGIKSKHLVLNTQTRPGQSGSPVFRMVNGLLVGIIIGSYAPGGGGGISLGGVDPSTLHQTTHAISSEYLLEMY